MEHVSRWMHRNYSHVTLTKQVLNCLKQSIQTRKEFTEKGSATGNVSWIINLHLSLTLPLKQIRFLSQWTIAYLNIKFLFRNIYMYMYICLIKWALWQYPFAKGTNVYWVEFSYYQCQFDLKCFRGETKKTKQQTLDIPCYKQFAMN